MKKSFEKQLLEKLNIEKFDGRCSTGSDICKGQVLRKQTNLRYSIESSKKELLKRDPFSAEKKLYAHIFYGAHNRRGNEGFEKHILFLASPEKIDIYFSRDYYVVDCETFEVL